MPAAVLQDSLKQVHQPTIVKAVLPVLQGSDHLTQGTRSGSRRIERACSQCVRPDSPTQSMRLTCKSLIVAPLGELTAGNKPASECTCCRYVSPRIHEHLKQGVLLYCKAPMDLCLDSSISRKSAWRME